MQNISTGIYRQGLVHNIYKIDSKIFKVPKSQFPDFNNRNHFDIELASLKFLEKNGIPCPKSIKVTTCIIKGLKQNCIEESFIQDRQYESWEVLTEKSLQEIVRIYNIVHKIDIKGAGILNKNLTGSSEDWYTFMQKSIFDSLQHLKSMKTQYTDSTFPKLLNEFELLLKKRKLQANSFLMVDFNPGNIFFDVNDNAIYIIDIDHPMAGDFLYDFSSVNWYNNSTFEKILGKYIKLDLSEIRLVHYYTLVFGLGVIIWRLQHNLSCEEDFKRLTEEINYIRIMFH